MRSNRITYDARHIFALCHIDPREDFHTLDSSQVLSLLDCANGYRKPKNANGSRGRYFHAYLCRILARERK